MDFNYNFQNKFKKPSRNISCPKVTGSYAKIMKTNQFQDSDSDSNDSFKNDINKTSIMNDSNIEDSL